MRDVSHKVNSLRIATASAIVHMRPETVDIVRMGKAPKGDPLSVARVAATMAAKNTPSFIPYCHPVPVEHVVVEFEVRESTIECIVTVKTVYKTGVEVEAMAAAAVAALNIYDLLKPVDEDISISEVKLISKTGGKSGWITNDGFSASVVTVSDRGYQREAEDISGPILESGLLEHGATDVRRTLVPDESDEIAKAVRACQNIDVVLVTGGTGVGPRDITPEAVAPLLDVRLPGVEEQFRRYGQDRIGTSMLSRCVAGVMGRTLVICLPGSPGACRDAIAGLFPQVLHVLPMLTGGGHD